MPENPEIHWPPRKPSIEINLSPTRFPGQKTVRRVRVDHLVLNIYRDETGKIERIDTVTA